MDKSNLPIGIFDSGIGGLTVAREILRVLPNESIIYVGDTARVPYGTRDPKTIESFAIELENFLLTQNVKVLVVACNTISATCLPKIKEIAGSVQVIDVISPTVKEAVKRFDKSVGVIGTRATINSKVYEKQIKDSAQGLEIKAKACPLFVPIVEEGLVDDDAARLIAKNYLKELEGIQGLILGCTHYPMIENIISETLPGTTIIDSSKPTTEALKNFLMDNHLENKNRSPRHRFIVTDSTSRSQEIADLFFENKMPGRLEKIELINY